MPRTAAARAHTVLLHTDSAGLCGIFPTGRLLHTHMRSAWNHRPPASHPGTPGALCRAKARHSPTLPPAAHHRHHRHHPMCPSSKPRGAWGSARAAAAHTHVSVRTIAYATLRRPHPRPSSRLHPHAAARPDPTRVDTAASVTCERETPTSHALCLWRHGNAAQVPLYPTATAGPGVPRPPALRAASTRALSAHMPACRTSTA